jgi:hypothetical protein
MTLAELIRRGGASVDELMDCAAAQLAAGDHVPMPEGMWERTCEFMGAIATRDAALLEAHQVEEDHPTAEEQARALAFLLDRVDLPDVQWLRLQVLTGHLTQHEIERLADLLVELIERARIMSSPRESWEQRLALLGRPPRERRVIRTQPAAAENWQ